MIFMGDDWSEDHHDVYLMDQAGKRLASRRLPEGLTGIRQLHELIAAHVEDPEQVVIGIETDRGPWVGALTAAGYQVYAINPLAVAHYRDRHHVSGAKSDASDAKLLADLVRTDRHNHRPIAGDSPDAEAIKVLARAHQNLIWTRTRHTNALRSALREYYPAALVAFEDLAHGDALGPFSAWLGVMVWVCESCCGAVVFGPWEGDVEVGEDESLDGGEPVEDESAAACVGGVQVGEGG